MQPEQKKTSAADAFEGGSRHTSGDETITDDAASQIAGGFNPQPDPPARLNPVSNPLYNPVINPTARP